MFNGPSAMSINNWSKERLYCTAYAILFNPNKERNSTSLVLKECSDENDGSQFFQTTRNGQIVHNIYIDYCLEANHPNVIMK